VRICSFVPGAEMDPSVRSALRAARRLVVFTGAGVSAESGLRTFRDRQGALWKAFNPQELATPEAFARDPALVWGWYEWRRAAVLAARPNPAHEAIAAMARHVQQLTVVTQNVDDLHERAGSSDVVHLHGEIARPYCGQCRAPHTLPAEAQEIPAGGARINPPRCERCGGTIRPGVVWFGESLPQEPWRQALNATQSCDAFVCCGTSGVVYPAAALPEIACARRVVTIQVNPDPTPMDAAASLVMRAAAGEALPRLLRETWGDS
jgi:NAD-dependent deacetylase